MYLQQLRTQQKMIMCVYSPLHHGLKSVGVKTALYLLTLEMLYTNYLHELRHLSSGLLCRMVPRFEMCSSTLTTIV